MDRLEIEHIASEQLDTLLKSIIQETRVHLWRLYLGDDLAVDEKTAAEMLGISPRQLKFLADVGEVSRGYLGKSPRYGVGAIRGLSRRLACEHIRTV